MSKMGTEEKMKRILGNENGQRTWQFVNQNLPPLAPEQFCALVDYIEELTTDAYNNGRDVEAKYRMGA